MSNSNHNFLIDTHCHLNMLVTDISLEEVLNNAKKNNVKILNNICTNVDDMSQILSLGDEYADTYGNIFCSVGHHPEELVNKIIKLDDLLKWTSNKKVIALGESGLDYHYGDVDRELQKKNFKLHIEASQYTNLPLIIHSREADEDMAKILSDAMGKKKFKFILHCFSSGLKLAQRGLELGGYISLSGIVTFKNSDGLRDIVRTVPIDRLLVETDSPYLAPVPMRGKKNQPTNVKYVASFVADFLAMDYGEFSNITTDNAFEVFGYDGAGCVL